MIAALASPGRGGNIAAFLVGAAQVASLAPLNWWPLGILCALAMLQLLEPLNWRQAFWRGWCYGSGLFLTGISWLFLSIHVYSQTPVPYALIITVGFSLWMGLYPAIFWGLWGCLRGAAPLLRRLVAFPACWVLGEWFRTWFFTGFPWLFIGSSHIDTALAGWAPISGVLGVGFAVAATAAAGHGLLHRRRPAWMLLLLALIWGGGAVLKQLEWTVATDRKPLRVAIIQANIELENKFSDASMNAIRDRYRAFSEPLWADHDLLLWSETAIAGGFNDNRAFLKSMDQLGRERNVALITGIAERIPQGPPDFTMLYYNTALAIGKARGRYRKRHLVPFGEYVPLQHWLRGLIPFFDLPLSSFSSGPEQQQPLFVKGNRTDLFICYEIAYPDLVASSLGEYGLLVTISEDSWFGNSLAPRQHLQIAQMRALETRRPLLRSANSGISAIIDHHGKIRQRSNWNQHTVLSDTITIRTGKTPFVRFGSTPLLTLITGMLIISLMSTLLRWRTRR